MVKASFTVYGDVWSPDLLSSALDVQPTNTVLKGVVPRPMRPPAPYTEWTCETPELESGNVDGPFKTLLEPFAGKTAILSAFVKQHGLRVIVNLVIQVKRDLPELFVSEANVRLLAALGANLGLDVYILDLPND